MEVSWHLIFPYIVPEFISGLPFDRSCGSHDDRLTLSANFSFFCSRYSLSAEVGVRGLGVVQLAFILYYCYAMQKLARPVRRKLDDLGTRV